MCKHCAHNDTLYMCQSENALHNFVIIGWWPLIWVPCDVPLAYLNRYATNIWYFSQMLRTKICWIKNLLSMVQNSIHNTKIIKITNTSCILSRTNSYFILYTLLFYVVNFPLNWIFGFSGLYGAKCFLKFDNL